MSSAALSRPIRFAGWFATLLSAAWFGVHTFVGGAEVAGPLRTSGIDPAILAPSWMVWHMVTGLLALMALLFGWATLAARPDPMLAGTGMALVLSIAGIAAAPIVGVGYDLLPQGFLFVPVVLAGAYAWRGMTQG